MKTVPSVKDLPLQGVERHFKGWPENERHNKHQRILQSQNVIGWEQTSKGRMSEEWEKNYDKCARINKDADENVNGLKWTINIIDKTWKWFLNKWQERNDKMHGVDEITRSQRERDATIRKVRWLCNLKDKAMPAHRDVCYETVEEHCKIMTTSQMTTWNNMSGPMLTSSAKCADTNGTQGTRPTNHWFPMTPDTTPEKT